MKQRSELNIQNIMQNAHGQGLLFRRNLKVNFSASKQLQWTITVLPHLLAVCLVLWAIHHRLLGTHPHLLGSTMWSIWNAHAGILLLLRRRQIFRDIPQTHLMYAVKQGLGDLPQLPALALRLRGPHKLSRWLQRWVPFSKVNKCRKQF